MISYGMRITFDPDFDSGSWPGPLHDPHDSGSARTAAAGEPWVGPMGLLGILETALGLGGLHHSSIERAAALSAVIRSTEGFWSRSAEKDPIGVARVLLHWIDWLRYHGWAGQPPHPPARETSRLRDLAALAPAILPGIPDRLASVSAALDKRKPDIESITSFEPIESLLPLWRKIFAQLASHGIKIAAAAPFSPARAAAPSRSAALPASDLRAALSPGFNPAGDGSLVLFRPYGPLEAAEQLAALLAASPDPSDTIIINPDVVFDEALRRFGLPTAGGREAVSEDPLLQILPLVLAMGWDPPDPQRALELLLIPDGPVPSRVSARLRAALQEWPAVGSDAWNRALAEEPASPFASRLQAIFKPEINIGGDYPAAKLIARAGLVKEWANARRFSLDDPQSTLARRLAAVAAQGDLFTRLVELSGLPSFTDPQIHRLILEIAESSSPACRYPAQIGLFPLASPGAVAGPAPRIIWWDFSEDSAPLPKSVPLSAAELAALRAQNVSITPATELAAVQSRRWRRPLEYATEKLICVCPLFGDDGEERHPHPLWDEVLARLSKDASRAALEKTDLFPSHTLPPQPSPSVPMRTDPPLSLPEPKRSWTVAASSLPGLPRDHSPSSLQSLIGCPFKWTLERLAKLRPPEIAALSEPDRLVGNLAHRIVEEVLRAAPGSPAEAEILASELFEKEGPRLAAPIFLPGASVSLAVARMATVASARSLCAHLAGARLRVVSLESPLEASVADFKFRGRPDLVAGDPAVIIDLKWSGETYHRRHLENGAALQLASYAYLLKTGKDFPPVAYFILSNQRLVALRGGPFPRAHTLSGPPLEATWEALLASMNDALSAVRQGLIEALGIPIDEETPIVEEDELSDGQLHLAPSCKFCHFGLLCGLDWEGVR